MICFGFILFFITVLSNSCDGMQVNLQGSVILGKEVMEAISQMVSTNHRSGRRHFSNTESEFHVDTPGGAITVMVKSAFLCHDLDFCKDDLEIIINEYVITLAEAVEGIFRGLIADADRQKGGKIVKAIIFEEEIKRILRHIKNWIENANEKMSDDKNLYAYIWIELLKKINAKFQDAAIGFASQELEGKIKETTGVKKNLTHKLVAATSSIELEFENKLCSDSNICSPSQECTKALKTLLEQINTVPDTRAKEFIRYFHEALPSTNFYYRINDVTAHEFQTILNDMAYGNNVSTKNILSAVQNIVDERLNVVTSTKEVKLSGRDVKLVHVILSDMDHFYSKHKKEPFYEFLRDFFEWTKTGGKFASPLRRIMKDLQNMLSFESDDLVSKLVSEVRVFMEIAVDPNP